MLFIFIDSVLTLFNFIMIWKLIFIIEKKNSLGDKNGQEKRFR
jgi:hypothetical protein